MKIRNKEFDFENDYYIMGILNFTPDSFSDGGKFNTPDACLKHVEDMIKEGASIIDVGGESTRPGYTMVSVEEETKRVVSAISAIRKEFDIPVSVDTYKSEVASAALECGADMINDIWGFKYDAKMAEVCAKYGVPACIMHNRDLKNNPYTDFFTDYLNDIKESIMIANNAGVSNDMLILDPGVGFAKDYELNLLVIKNLSMLKEFNMPILLGTSRKSVLKKTVNDYYKELSPECMAEALKNATVSTTLYGMLSGAHIFRVHDVFANTTALNVCKEILK